MPKSKFSAVTRQLSHPSRVIFNIQIIFGVVIHTQFHLPHIQSGVHIGPGKGDGLVFPAGILASGGDRLKTLW